MRKSLHIVCNYYVLRTYAMNNKLVLHNVNTLEIGRVSFMLRMHKKEVVGSAKYVSCKIKKKNYIFIFLIVIITFITSPYKL